MTFPLPSVGGPDVLSQCMSPQMYYLCEGVLPPTEECNHRHFRIQHRPIFAEHTIFFSIGGIGKEKSGALKKLPIPLK